MPPLLYLDTARLGQVSPSAKRALISALEINQAFGASAYFDELFFRGAENSGPTNQFDGLEIWKGIDQFSVDARRQMFGATAGDIAFASRTGVLMAMATRLLSARCTNVLVSDLNWQPFTEMLTNRSAASKTETTTVAIREAIFNHTATAEEVIEKIKTAFVANQCDGIFLPAICNLGVALPIVKIILAIREIAELRFCVIDAAQAVNHIDLSQVAEGADFVFGGTHKWLRACEPMAVGYFGRAGSRSFIQASIDRELLTNPSADPMLRLTQSSADKKSETVNLCPLFAAAGALADARECDPKNNSQISRLAIQEAAQATGWNFISSDSSLHTQIVLLKKQPVANSKGRCFRKQLSRLGVAITEYNGGVCRISMPESLDDSELKHLRFALNSVV